MTTMIIILQNGSRPARMRVRTRNAEGEFVHTDPQLVPYEPGGNTWAQFYLPDGAELIIDEPAEAEPAAAEQQERRE